MIECGGVYLPDGEKHLVEWMRNDPNAREVDGKLTYQFHKFEAAMMFCRDFRVAVDVGAHCGLWSMHLVKRFQFLEAFEPVQEFRACWYSNVRVVDIPGEKYAQLNPFALGAAPGRVALTTRPTSSGDTYVSGEGDIEMRTLDSFGFHRLDFIKIDVEGYELQVVQGGIETLKRCRPCVIVEQKEKNLKANFAASGIPAVDLLRALGANLRTVLSGDYVLSWDPQ